MDDGSAVRVSGLPGDMEEEDLEEFFQDKRRGGCQVLRVELQTSEGTALVFFHDPSAADKVVQLGPKFKYGKRELEVEVHVPCTKKPGSESAAMSRMLVVRGLQGDVDKDDVADFFEHKKRGGFEVDKVELDTATASAVVYFMKEEAVAEVLSLAPFEWRRKTLELKSFAEEQREKEEEARRMEEALSRMLVVRNLPDNVDEDDVADFFEHKKRGGFDVAKVELDQVTASAIVRFEDQKGVNAILKCVPLEWKTKTLDIESYRSMLRRKEEEERERERALSCMLMVRGFPKDSDEEDVSDYFEHRKRGGFAVDKVVLGQEAGTAIVHFEDEKAVEKVLQAGPYQLKRATLELSSYRSELQRQQEAKEMDSGETTTEVSAGEHSRDLEMTQLQAPCSVVQVTELPHSVSESKLRDFFERRATSGGYPVVKVKLDPATKSALVHFDDPQAVESTLKKAPFLMDKKQITVKAYRPNQEDSQQEEEEGEAEVEELCTVAVRGFRDLSKDTLELYFDNPRRSAGGQMKDCRLDEKEGVAYVTFESAQVAARVCEKTDHMVQGNSLEVTLYKEPPSYTDRVLLSDLSPNVSKESLVNYLEARAHLSPVDILYGEEGTALVTFDSEFDMAALDKVFIQKTLEGCKVKASKVRFSDAVLVKDVPDHMTKDHLELYFDNTRKSGGENVRRVRKVGQGMWVVNFEDQQVASRVSRGQHRLGSATLQVSLYLECLGPGGGESDPLSFLVPPPLAMPWLHPLLPRFLKESAPQSQAFRELLEKRHAQASLDDVTTLTVTCTLTRESRDGKLLAKTWKEKVEADIKSFLGRLQWKEIRMTATVFTQVEKEKRQIPAPKGKVIIHSQPQDSIFLVLGEVDAVTAAVSAITKLQGEHEAELERIKQTVTDTVPIREPHKLRFLLVSNFTKAAMDKHRGLRADISLQDRQVTFHGLLRDVNNAHIELLEQVQSLRSSRASVSSLVQSLLGSQKVQQVLAQELQSRQLTAVWEIKNQELVVWAATDQVAVDTVQRVKAAILEQRVPLDRASLVLLDTKAWRETKAAAMKGKEGCMEVREDKDKRELVIAGLDLSTAEDIRNFFTEHTIYRKTLRFPPGRHSFMIQHLASKIQEIEGNFVGQKVSIKFGEGSEEFKLEGTKIGLERVETGLRNLASSIKSQKHTLSDANIVNFLREPRGKEVIALVEKERCIIREANDPTDQPTVTQGQGQSGTGVETYVYQLAVGSNLHVTQASMTNLNVDAIVNAANDRLHHIGGLAKAIADKAGPTFQKECDAYVKSHGLVKEGEVAVTGAGSLPCRKVIHAVGPRYQGGQSGEEAKLKSAVTESLRQAEKLGLTSIALPAISCGNLGYPEREATQVIVEAVLEFFQANASLNLQDVYLCDISPSTFQCFRKEASKKLQPVRPGSTHDTAGRPRNLPLDGPCPGLNVVQGELADQQADVLVNTTSTSLNLSRGTVSISLLNKGGQQLQQELDRRYPDGLPSGEVFAITSGGHLRARAVFHAVLPNWAPGKEKFLSELLEQIVKTADSKGYASVAFPALGTGVLGYPHDVVASCFLFAASNILPLCSYLKEMRVVLYHADTKSIQAFRPLTASSVDPFPSPGKPAGKASRKFSSTPDSASSVDSQTFHLGDVSIHMKQGDIVEEKADVIVNPINPNLDFGSDGVSGTIAERCGQALKDACSKKKEKKKMHSKGIVSTDAPNLSSKFILHVHAPHFHSLKEAAKVCLSKAVDKKATSIAFPMLCTAKESAPGDWAKGLLDAVTEMQTKGDLSMLHDVRVVIVDAQDLANVATAAQALMDTPQAKKEGWMSRLLGLFDSSHPKPTVPAVSLFAFSDDNSVLDRVPERIQSYLNKELLTQTIQDSVIKDLSREQTAALKRLEVRHHVTITPSADKSSLDIRGLPNHVSSAMAEVYSALRERAKFLGESMTAGAMAAYIKWGYMDKDGRHMYDPRTSATLERAYNAKEPLAKIQDGDGSAYVVDLVKMEEHPENDLSDTVQVFRETAGDKAPDLGKLPDTWSSMGDDEDVKVVQLDGADPDYLMVKGEWDKTIGQAPPTIDSIWRVQIRTLHLQYQSREQAMTTMFPGRKNDRLLWFGTAAANTTSINTFGFDRSKIGEGGPQGIGVYFLVSAEEATKKATPDSGGLRHAYLSRVLVGECITRLDPNSKVLPYKDKDKAILYDSVVDDVPNPKVFVIFHDAQAYPEFLVKFK